MKKIVLTGGGTAGHITPNIALIPRLRSAGFEISYIGLRGGMEEKLISGLGVPFYGITGGKLRRYADLKNFTDFFKVEAGFFEARRALRRIRPDVVFSKGGYVSTPVVWAASMMKIPVVSHESDMTMGLANRMSAPFAKKICYTFPETGASIPDGKGVYTGLPIRSELLDGDRLKGLSFCGFAADTPVVLAIGGSQGSEFINKTVRASLDSLAGIFSVCHIAGKGNLDHSLDGRSGYRQFEYITKELPDLFAMADVVVTRGGATSLFELLALDKPNIIIPYSLKASRGDQIINAESFKKQGFSEVLSENDGVGPKELVEMITKVYNDRARYIAAMKACPVRSGLDNVLAVICGQAGVKL
jgi:UDP-N-acetylglucosamine--N-acetylmuramyl-(pentapeptide) pyrophosphoryl-undecaprenol N-acetylglucosamine transferase